MVKIIYENHLGETCERFFLGGELPRIGENVILQYVDESKGLYQVVCKVSGVDHFCHESNVSGMVVNETVVYTKRC